MVSGLDFGLCGLYGFEFWLVEERVVVFLVNIFYFYRVFFFLVYKWFELVNVDVGWGRGWDEGWRYFGIMQYFFYGWFLGELEVFLVVVFCMLVVCYRYMNIIWLLFVICKNWLLFILLVYYFFYFSLFELLMLVWL